MGIFFSRPKTSPSHKKLSEEFSDIYGDTPRFPKRTSFGPPDSNDDRSKLALLSKDLNVASAWIEDVLPHWEQHVSIRGRKISRKVRTLCRTGIPSNLRGDVWCKAIGNALHVTPELYQIFYNHALNQRHETTAVALTMEDDTGDDSGIPLGAKYLGKEHSMQLIEMDLGRTFPHVKHFAEHKETLREVLQTYACYRPDVGYVQGMSYLAGMMLLCMDKYRAFVCLANLLNYHYFLTFFRMDVNKMRQYYNVFDALFADQLPSLHKHFRAVEITPEMYLMDWLLTLFSRVLPLEIACHIWDCYVLEGEPFMYRAALGIIRLYGPVMKNMDMGEILRILNRLQEADIDETKLFDSIFAISVSRNRVEALMIEQGLGPLR